MALYLSAFVIGRRIAASLISSPYRVAILQFSLYSVVGAICFAIDITVFVILWSLQWRLLSASATSFIASTIANYLLCCFFVFQRGRFSRHEELSRLFGIAIVGLMLNSAAVWFLAAVLGMNPALAKVLAVLPILVWNYLGRRALVFDGRPSDVAVMVAKRMRARL